MNNAAENIARNNCTKISLKKADGFLLTGRFDVILANINRNVILDNCSRLFAGLKAGGKLLMSGLYEEDEADLVGACEALGFTHIHTSVKEKWICMLFRK